MNNTHLTSVMIPHLVEIMWSLESPDGHVDKESINIDAWFENYDHPDKPNQKPDGRYSIEDARWIWNALNQNNGFETQ